MSSSRTHDKTDDRDLTGEVSQALQIVGTSARMSVGQAVPGALEHEDQGRTLLRRKLGESVAFVCSAIANGATQHGEILRTGQGRPATDLSKPCDQGISRYR